MASPKNDNRASQLLKNVSALGLVQIGNYIFPLLLIPYLSRVLGVEIYGVVAMGLGLSQLAFILTDYGFNLSATYLIAKDNKNKNFINKIMSSVFLCKLGLLAIAIFFLFMFIFFDGKYADYHVFFWFITLPIIGQAFQPVWLFQGLEKMVILSIITSIGRTIYLFSTLILVKDVDDYLWVAITNGLSQICIALIEIFLLFRMGYRFVWVKACEVKSVFIESTPFFWGRSAAAIYTAGGTVFLGLFSNSIQAGLYSAAEQLYKGALSLLAPLHQALYPYMARTHNVQLFMRILAFAVLGNLFAVSIGMYVSPWIVQMAFGAGFSDSSITLTLFMIVFLFVLPSSLLGFPFLAALGDSRTANMSIIYGGVIQLCLLGVCYFIGWINAIQMVFCIMIVEMIVLIIRSMAAYNLYKKYNVNFT
ncbi:oligosaccharide flippase family protein [Pectobacterium cacticida]|uniref:oligosaccharide flippase family protein n=1 Tax=Pectobacterium cacticida TaxID=69221 RepID=UPI002FF1D926